MNGMMNHPNPFAKLQDLGNPLSRRRQPPYILLTAYTMLVWILSGSISLFPADPIADGGALNGVRHRLVVSTDIGGTDPDDFQSLIHLLVYADILDIEGLISSPYGPGRRRHILEVIDHYARDYGHLKSYSNHYPSPDHLRSISKQGATEVASYAGINSPTEGSNWIIQCAQKKDPRPLHVLVWGGLEDLAQALADAPEILPSLRVYWIGGPNKKWSPDAYQFIVSHFPGLWMIESNSTYRGWFVGGDMSDGWDNKGFVARNIAPCGHLGQFFQNQLEGTIKMGDTPSVSWLLRGHPESPDQPGWGGQFVRAWKRPHVHMNHLPQEGDHMEIFGILELALPLPQPAQTGFTSQLLVENQALKGFVAPDQTLRFRFSPKAARTYEFSLVSSLEALDGMSGRIRAVHPDRHKQFQPSTELPHWWTDSLDPHLQEGEHAGAKSVNRWRLEFLRDFAARMQRCRQPQPRIE
ncbi:MAG: DUF1593 domain-containing protein [Verrucomicrobia bacterium]|nr:DUF1593 domain-containing protein [Verrucomicrobiota bacterium]